MRIFSSFLTGAAVLLAPCLLRADIVAVNERPETNLLAPSSPDRPGLEAILGALWYEDPQHYAGTDYLLTGQSTAGFFRVATPGTKSISPALYVAYSDLAESNTFGIWSFDPVGGGIQTSNVDLFHGAPQSTGSPESIETIASIMWNKQGQMQVGCLGDCSLVNTGTFNGINRNGFGFYVKSGGNTWYTLDALNNGEAHALVYQNPQGSDTFAFAFETDALSANGNAYDDLVVSVESIRPVPEPSTLVLLGSVAAIALFARRRISA